MEKDSFVFRKEWRDAVSGLPEEMRLEIYEAIMEYGFSGKLSELRPMAMLAFNFAKTTLDRDSERYEEIRKKRSKAGQMHKGNQYQNGTSVPKWNKMEQNGTNGTDSVYVGDMCSPNVEQKKEPPKGGKKKDAAQAASCLQKRKEEFQEKVAPYVALYGREMVTEFFEYWTEENRSKTKMRFELERTWNVDRRLKVWASRDGTYQTKAHGTEGRKDDARARRSADAARGISDFILSDA